VQSDALDRLRSEPIDWRSKGFPPTPNPVTPATVAGERWNVLAGDLLLPAMVLRESALEHNLALMARFCREHGVSLAPHGKTTMAPELFRRQLEAGAWGITAATPSQARIFRAFGVERILLANELVEPAAIRWVAAELAADPAFDFYCLADSTATVAAMTEALAGRSDGRPIQVLVELGIEGGRTGCRTLEDGEAVAAAIAASPGLELAGVEGYEGILHGDPPEDAFGRVDAFLDRLAGLLRRLTERDAFAGRQEIVLTAGGSTYFDRVVERLRPPPELGPNVRVVLRSGCYLTHDHVYYDAQSPFGARAAAGDRLQPALEVWGAVLSRPEPDLALVGCGKRDVPYDVDLPVPLLACRPGSGHPRDVAGAMAVTGLNDQHAYVRLSPDDELAPGDFLGCGISHPCTAFDKWRLIPVVDDEYTVVDAVRTFF
jgi:D-serine deaminase-like pyridoxal phosphate-dependent protein